MPLVFGGEPLELRQRRLAARGQMQRMGTAVDGGRDAADEVALFQAVEQMHQPRALDPEPLGDRPDRLAGLRLDLAAVELELDRRGRRRAIGEAEQTGRLGGGLAAGLHALRVGIGRGRTRAGRGAAGILGRGGPDLGDDEQVQAVLAEARRVLREGPEVLAGYEKNGRTGLRSYSVSGRVAKPGTVKPTEQFVIERYSHVMHIVSNVVGQLREGEDALSALLAGLPAGWHRGKDEGRHR